MGEPCSFHDGATTPVARPALRATSNVTQLFRYDIVRQITPARTDTWSYGFSKGFNLIPWHNTEVDINIPPYIRHDSAVKDGFGDFGAVLKYRLAFGEFISAVTCLPHSIR